MTNIINKHDQCSLVCLHSFQTFLLNSKTFLNTFIDPMYHQLLNDNKIQALPFAIKYFSVKLRL